MSSSASTRIWRRTRCSGTPSKASGSRSGAAVGCVRPTWSPRRAKEDFGEELHEESAPHPVLPLCGLEGAQLVPRPTQVRHGHLGDLPVEHAGRHAGVPDVRGEACPENCPRIKFWAVMETGGHACIDEESGSVTQTAQAFTDAPGLRGTLPKYLQHEPRPPQRRHLAFYDCSQLLRGQALGQVL